MTELKIVVSDPKTGKSYQKVIADNAFAGKKLKQKVRGDELGLGLEGYELEITGGSDDAGFPMREDIEGTVRKRALLTGGVGIKSKTRSHKEQGIRIRKSVAANTVHHKTAQVNLKILTYGAKPVEEVLGKKEEPKA